MTLSQMTLLYFIVHDGIVDCMKFDIFGTKRAVRKKEIYHHCSGFRKEWFNCTRVVKIPLLINVPWVQEIFHARFPVTFKSHTASLFAWLWPSAEDVPTCGRPQSTPPHATKTSGFSC